MKILVTGGCGYKSNFYYENELLLKKPRNNKR